MINTDMNTKVELINADNETIFYDFTDKNIYKLTVDPEMYSEKEDKYDSIILAVALITIPINKIYMDIANTFINIIVFAVISFFAFLFFTKYTRTLQIHREYIKSNIHNSVEIEYEENMIKNATKAANILMCMGLPALFISLIILILYFKFSILTLIIIFDSSFYLSYIFLIKTKIHKRYKAIKEMKKLYREKN